MEGVGDLTPMFLAIDPASLIGWACCGTAALVFLVIVGAKSGSKKKGKKRGSSKKRSRLDAYEESGAQNQQIIEHAYRQFDRLSAEEIKGLSKRLGKDMIGEPPTDERRVLKDLATAKKLDSATTLRQILSIRAELLELERIFCVCWMSESRIALMPFSPHVGTN